MIKKGLVRNFIIYFSILFCEFVSVKAQYYNNFQAANKKRITDSSAYPFIHEEFNVVQFYERSALEHFYKAWKNTNKRKMSIVHLGDSHIQLGVY